MMPVGTLSNMTDERYLSAMSGSMTTIVLPLNSSCSAIRIAAAAAAPQEIPTSKPSSLASRRAISMDSSLLTCSTLSTTDRSRFLGIKPAPIPWIL